MIPMMRPSQAVADMGGAIHRDFFRWLAHLTNLVSTGVVPVKGVVAVTLTPGELADWFDGSGLGNRGGPFEGWALANGNNGTTDYSLEPMAPYAMRLDRTV